MKAKNILPFFLLFGVLSVLLLATGCLTLGSFSMTTSVESGARGSHSAPKNIGTIRNNSRVRVRGNVYVNGNNADISGAQVDGNVILARNVRLRGQ